MFDREDDKKYKKWAKAVKVQGSFKCQLCGAENVYLESHHLNAWNAYPEQRYIVSNGRSLCYNCHCLFHLIRGKGNNTEEQWNEFVELYHCFKHLIEADKKE